MRKTNHPRIHWAWWLVGVCVLLAWQYWPHESAPRLAPEAPSTHAPDPVRAPFHAADESSTRSPSVARLPAFLPVEARTTIALIQRGGPFPHRQDGSLFGNREGHLPRQPRGWYHEYTVDTPGLSHRGTRRIITGGNPPQTWHYTSDHYASFRAFDPGTAYGALR